MGFPEKLFQERAGRYSHEGSNFERILNIPIFP